MSHPHIATKPQVLVTFSSPLEVRHGFAESPGALAVTTYLPDIGRNDRRRALASADAGLSWTPDREIDAWWQEPRRQGSVATRRPFPELPNVLGSAHNSAIIAGPLAAAARHAADNIARYLRGEPAQHLVDRSDHVEGDVRDQAEASTPGSPPPESYEILVRGHLGPMTLAAFDGLRAETRGKHTILTGVLPDQAALHGVLTQIAALGLELLGLRRLNPAATGSASTSRLTVVERCGNAACSRAAARSGPGWTGSGHYRPMHRQPAEAMLAAAVPRLLWVSGAGNGCAGCQGA